VAATAAAIGIDRGRLSKALSGDHVQARWLEALPAAVERLYLDERAQAHGCEMRPVGDAQGNARVSDVVQSLGAVLVSLTLNGDVDAVARELEANVAADAVLADRRAHLRAVIAARGPVRGGETA